MRCNVPCNLTRSIELLLAADILPRILQVASMDHNLQQNQNIAADGCKTDNAQFHFVQSMPIRKMQVRLFRRHVSCCNLSCNPVATQVSRKTSSCNTAFLNPRWSGGALRTLLPDFRLYHQNTKSSHHQTFLFLGFV